MRFTFVLMAIVGCMAAGRSAAAVARHPSSDGGHGRVNASEIPIVVGNSDRVVNLQELSGMRIAEVERLTGKKMGWVRKWETAIALRKLRHVCLNVFGIPIAYLIHDERRHRRIRWAWIGLVISDTLLGTLIAVLSAEKRGG